MTSHYRYQFPIAFHFYKWGCNTWFQHPIVRQYIAPPGKSGDGDISIFLTIFDEDD